MRETSPSLYDLRRSGSRNPLSQDLKFIYDEGYVWVSTTHNFIEDFMFGEEKLEKFHILSKIYGARMIASRLTKI